MTEFCPSILLSIKTARADRTLPFHQFHISAKMQNDKGQGVSHAKDSALPQRVQEKVRIDLEISRKFRLTKNAGPLKH